jgi:hypothetical protein
VLVFFSFLVGDDISLFSTSIGDPKIIFLSKLINIPLSKGKSGSDFLFLEETKGCGELSFKINKDVVDLLSDVITVSFVLSKVGSKLSELSDGVLLENVTVHLKFISNV